MWPRAWRGRAHLEFFVGAESGKLLQQLAARRHTTEDVRALNQMDSGQGGWVDEVWWLARILKRDGLPLWECRVPPRRERWRRLNDGEGEDHDRDCQKHGTQGRMEILDLIEVTSLTSASPDSFFERNQRNVRFVYNLKSPSVITSTNWDLGIGILPLERLASDEPKQSSTGCTLSL
jgi:hypothetical protein